MSLGYPLYVNGREVRGPLTISHRPTAGLGHPYRPGFGSSAINPLVAKRPGFGSTALNPLVARRPGFGADAPIKDDAVLSEYELQPQEMAALAVTGTYIRPEGKYWLYWSKDGRSPMEKATDDKNEHNRMWYGIAAGVGVAGLVAGYMLSKRR